MDKEQELEWAEAQKIVISEDLVAAAKRQLVFLAAVDRNRWLYDGPALQKAIFRYNAYWLPFLMKHHEEPLLEGPLVVPLDCEWIWHCHRLNPIRYHNDCEKLYGKILDGYKVVSSTGGALTAETKKIWNKMFPEEPYDLDLKSTDILEKSLKGDNFTDYDLASAVERQSPFFYQVSSPYVNTDLFLEEALARYKGFLHMIRRNRERSIRRFCVPTYDIDLLWHTHQLHPVSYGKDMMKLLGRILEHDDMDADRSKGAKLDVGFSGTTKQWEDSFGTRYWKAGAMYRGSAPAPVTDSPYPFKSFGNKIVSLDQGHKILQLAKLEYVEVLLEIVDVRNLPEGLKGSTHVMFSKKQSDSFFTAKRKLNIFSQAGEKEVASFQCEPKGEINFELMYHKQSHLPLSKQWKPLGSTSFSISEFLAKGSALSAEKWFELVPSSASNGLMPVGLRIAIAVTLPTSAPYVLQMARPRSFLRNSCFLPLSGRANQSKSCTPVLDDAGEEIISLQMRDAPTRKEDNCTATKEVVGLTKSGEVHSLAHMVGNTWLSAKFHWNLKKSNDSTYLFDLVGARAVRLYSGRKLECQSNHCGNHRSEPNFITAVEFSAEKPYGAAVALIDLKSGFITVKEEWFLVPGITLGFIVAELLKKDGYNGLTAGEVNSMDMSCDVPNAADGFCEEPGKACLHIADDGIGKLKVGISEAETVMTKQGILNSGGCGGCGAGCGGSCSSMVKSGGCGGCGGGGGCGGDFVKATSDGVGDFGRAAGGFGCGGLENTEKSAGGCGGCGGGCGSGCGGDFVKATSDGVGTLCGASGGCGCKGLDNTEKNAGGCGGCGSGCGGCGGACGVNSKSTHQSSAAPASNTCNLPQVPVEAY